MKRSRGTAGPALAWMLGLLLVSAALVWHDLGTREVLGRDENATITKLDQPSLKAVLDVTYMKVTGEPGNMQPLYFLAQYLVWPLVGRNAFVLRFLPSVFGLLSVAMVYPLGAALWNRRVGLVGALFTALLPLHVEYSQIARPYTLLAFLSLASAYFLMRALQTNRPLAWVGFAVTAALSFYTHLNAIFVLAAEAILAASVWLASLARAHRTRRRPKGWWVPPFAFLALGLLCLPGVIRLVRLPWAGSGGTVAVELTLPFFYRYLYKIGLTTAWLRALVLGSMALGLLATLFRRRPFLQGRGGDGTAAAAGPVRPALDSRWAAVLVVLWLAFPFLILAVMNSPRPFHERYLIFVPPVALLLAARGVVAAGAAARALSSQKSTADLQALVTLVVAVGMALFFVQPLRTYYIANRTEDRLDQTLAVLERHALPDDVILVSRRFFVRPLQVPGTVLYLTHHLSAQELDALLQHSPRLWILYTSFLPPAALQEPLDQWVQSHAEEFARVPIKAITALAYHNHTFAEAATTLVDRLDVLQDLAAVSADPQEAWMRYGAVADTCDSLANLYAARGEPTAAEQYRHQAEEARSVAPRPW